MLRSNSNQQKCLRTHLWSEGAKESTRASIAYSCLPKHEKDRTPLGQDGLGNAILYISGVKLRCTIHYKKVSLEVNVNCCGELEGIHSDSRLFTA
jgi:hypothetical protein